MCQNKSMECLACVAKVGRALHGVCQALASCLVNEMGISCRPVKQVDEHVFVVRYGAKGVTVPHANLTPNQESSWSDMESSILVDFNGYTDASETGLSMGGRKAGKWE